MEKRRGASTSALSTRWPTRILILAIFGALFLTLFPFRFTLHARVLANRSPFLLGGRGKDSSALNDFLNVLLFIPFGFAIAAKLRERSRSWSRATADALALGALFSYGIEFVQLYTVGRDSGWEDVVTNVTGALLGSIFFGLCGRTILSLLFEGEAKLDRLLTWSRTAKVMLMYFAACFAISAFAQIQTRLTNWHSDDLLVLGNNAAGESRPSWRGEVLLLQLWNRALPREIVPRLASGQMVPGVESGLLGSYDFAGPHPFRDKTNSLPNLTWTTAFSNWDDPPSAFDGKAWLTSKLAVPTLVSAVKKTNKFTVRVVCKPAEASGIVSSIASLSIRHPNLVDMEIGQENSALFFLLRNPLSGSRTVFGWLERNTIVPHQVLDIVFSYDGATASVYLQGMPRGSYRLGPGAAVARLAHEMRPSALDLYACGYYFVIFFTAGILAGIALRRISSRPLILLVFVALGVVIPALLLEFILAGVSGRPISWVFAAYSAGAGLAGVLWINTGVRRDGNDPAGI